MNKKVLLVIVFSLFAINIFTWIYFIQSKKQDTITFNQDPSKKDKLHAYESNFITSINNNGIKLGEVILKDSLGNIFSFNDIWENGQEQILVCRFSELHCQSCVNSSIKMLLLWADPIGRNNLLFLGAYRNNRILNRTKYIYDIQDLITYNTPALNIPAEELGYPYFFVLNKDMTVTNLFVPDKANSAITNNYLELIYNRFFNTQ